MITAQEYGLLDKAYAHFNATLFNNELPDCIITLNRKAKTRGYFHFQKFVARDDSGKLVSEIALNPDAFVGRTDKEILSTLLHETVHLWQNHSDVPCRKGYHDKTWATKMKDVGLQPTHDGTPDGKCTGQSMTHLVIDGGKFDKSCDAFLTELEGGLNWDSAPDIAREKKNKKSTRAKFTCPECSNSVWGKESINIICGDCKIKMEIDDGVGRKDNDD
jgi:predicted SprT family Zn-dependent metalloprotease